MPRFLFAHAPLLTGARLSGALLSSALLSAVLVSAAVVSAPAAEGAADTSGVVRPTVAGQVVGDGSAASCTSAAVVRAVALGGTITFSCGTAPKRIVMSATAKVRNDASADVVIDGGGLITLSGAGKRRILYQDTCDPAQVWTTDHCDDQATPRLTIRRMTFVDGNSTGESYDGGGGGAVFVRGGTLSITGSRFYRNQCDSTGPDLGGGAIRVLSQYHGTSVAITGSTFGGSVANANRCSNGGALSSIGVSWVVTNSVLSFNQAIGHGANPARPGTPGGGSGGAIYNDGNTMTLSLVSSTIQDNHANEGGGAIFFVSNDRTGTLRIQGSTLRRNPNDGFSTAGYPGIFYLGQGDPVVIDSTITP